MRYKNALCVYPYKRELKSLGFLPPIGLEYIAGAIENIVESVKIIDLRYEEKPLTTFIDKNTDLVLISHNWDFEEEFVKASINSIPENISVILGGRYATEHVNELLENVPRINGIVRGDGEEIARVIVERGISPDVDGLSFRSEGKIVHNKNRRLEKAPGDFYPNRRLRRYKYMAKVDEFVSDIQIDLVLGSRGCPYNCKFCDFKFNPLGQKRMWSVRTPESVISELRTLEADVICFADDIFTADMDWVERLSDLIIREGLKKKYVINARLEVAKRPDVLKKMYKAGFMGFLMGIESAQDKTLASMNKGFTTEKVREFFEVLRQFNFFYHCYFIIGNIGETRDEMIEIAKFSHDIGADTLGLSLLRASKYSPLKGMLSNYDNYHIEEESGKIYSDQLLLEDLQQIRRDIYASFYKVPLILRVIKKLMIHKLLTLRRINKIILFAVRRKIKKRATKKAIHLTT
jgi:anaerobic magnesium-protoporphyrin IX monomethyl ester cyclase